MSLVKKFRLTKLLHDQVEISGDQVDSVLRSWDERDYRSLCEYVTQCRGIVPKYIARLARMTGISSGNVVMDIVGAQAPDAGFVNAENHQGGPEGIGYIPEDSVERFTFLRSLTGER